MARTHGVHRHAHRGAGCQAVVDENDKSAREVGCRTRAPIQGLAPRQLGLLARHDGVEFGARHTDLVEHRLVNVQEPAARQRTQRQFLVPRGADLAHHEHVEWHAQGQRHLITHGDAAAREGEHEHVSSPLQGAESVGELPAGVPSVAKQ